MVKYEDMKESLVAACISFSESVNAEGKTITVKDNGEIWFYFNMNGELINVRSY